MTDTEIDLYQGGSTPVSTVVAGSKGGLYVSLKATTALAGGDTVTLTAPQGGSFDSGLSGLGVNFMINETSDPGANHVINSMTFADGGRTVNLQVPSMSLAAGERLGIRLAQYQDKVAFGTLAGQNGMEVSTSKDTDPVETPQYTIDPAEPASLAALDGPQRTAHDQDFDPMRVGVEDEFGNLVANQDVTATVAPSGASGTFPGPASSATVNTGSSGEGLLPTVKANGIFGGWDLALDGPGGLESSYEMTNLEHGDPAVVDVGLMPSSVPADGSSQVTATATVSDRFGNLIPGEDLAFSSSGSQQIGAVTDNGDGTYDAQLTASTTSGTSTITATDDSPPEPLAGTATLTQTPLPATSIKLTLTPDSIPADGKSSVTGKAVVRNALGNPVANARVAFKSSGGQKISAVKNVGDGNYTVTITASNTVGSSTVTASVVGTGPALAASATLSQTKAKVVKPTLKFVKPPKKKVKAAKVKFRFKVVKGTARGFQCRIDRKKWSKCKSPKVVKLKRGKHVFRVRGVASDGSHGKAIVRKVKRIS